MRLLVFARRHVASRVTNVECGRRGTGVGDRLGNKGGVVVTLRLHDTSLAFVASHLEAFQHSVGGRNADFAAIAGGVPLGKKGADLLSQFDHVFWCGDLNYRIDPAREAGSPGGRTTIWSNQKSRNSCTV